MMAAKKTINVPRVDKGFAAKASFCKLRLECVNWAKEFPYCPQVVLYLAHDEEKLLVCFEVQEKNARAVTLEPNGPVWEDSCVEVFLRVPGEPHYFNFETNCIGTGLAAKRLSRRACTHFTAEELSRIVRRSSLPREATDLKGDCRWSLEVEIPFSTLDCKACPEALEANFYKCGDKTEIPHFVSWSPIETAAPDFHRPEFFGTIILAP